MTRIGVFDSGVGGLAIAEALERALPDDTIIFIRDTKHMPYGDKPPAKVLKFVIPLLKRLEKEKCELIVIACNTVTTTLIKDLRAKFKTPIVGIEPMIKPAATLTRTGIIGVLATPATLGSARYAYLKKTHAHGLEVIEPDCSKWATMIEDNKVNHAQIREQIEELCKAGADMIVLGCTHYHWIETLIKQVVADRATVIQPEQAIVARVKKVLGRV